MVKNTGKAITEFLEHLKKAYQVQPSTICEMVGLNGSSARKWSNGTNPYKDNVLKIRDYIVEKYPKEVTLFDSLLGIGESERKFTPADVGPEDDISTQIKVLESVIRSRFPGDEEKIRAATETVTEQLVKYGYEFALRVAKEISFQKSMLDDEGIPTEVILLNTQFSPVTFGIEGVEGFYIDVMRTPHNSIAYYLWHECCGEKMLFFDYDAVEYEKIYKTIEEGTPIIIKECLHTAIHIYLETYIENGECEHDT